MSPREKAVRFDFIDLLLLLVFTATGMSAGQVRVEGGEISGISNSDQTVRMFLGIPFAAPPLANLRWREPQPVNGWTGVRMADRFGPRCMQTRVYADMVFRDNGPSEDCLYLNVWAPARPTKQRLPVVVWFYGGGFVAGAGSEPRYDGENLAKKGAVIVIPNYRLGVFGFFAHRELTQESGRNASGNYGLLDQVAALQWVRRNIAQFGGDPHNVTISGESAGSFSVSALMASPLAQGLFQKAIGESGAFFPSGLGPQGTNPLRVTEQLGAKFVASVGANSLAELRAKPADELVDAAAKDRSGLFWPSVDGYFLLTDVSEVYAQGKQSHVPLLAGWNADEGKLFVLLGKEKPTAKKFAEQAHTRFGDQADAFLKLYPAATDEEAVRSADELAGDDFIAYSTWKWIEMQMKTGKSPVYRYRFELVPPEKPGAVVAGVPLSATGSRHACEIEYVFATLQSKGAPLTREDIKLADALSSYWVNFARKGNPNGKGLPKWPAYNDRDHYQVMHLAGRSVSAAPAKDRERYEFLDIQLSKSTEKKGGK
jgi:para-nitrobenzyl esterase